MQRDLTEFGAPKIFMQVKWVGYSAARDENDQDLTTCTAWSMKIGGSA